MLDIASGVSPAQLLASLPNGSVYEALDPAPFPEGFLLRFSQIMDFRQLKFHSTRLEQFDLKPEQYASVRLKNVSWYIPSIVDEIDRIGRSLTAGGHAIIEAELTPWQISACSNLVESFTGKKHSSKFEVVYSNANSATQSSKNMLVVLRKC